MGFGCSCFTGVCSVDSIFGVLMVKIFRGFLLYVTKPFSFYEIVSVGQKSIFMASGMKIYKLWGLIKKIGYRTKYIKKFGG